MLGTGSNVVDGLDEKVDQVIGQRPAAQMDEGRKPCEPGRLRMPAQDRGADYPIDRSAAGASIESSRHRVSRSTAS
jgi:hypothetical protein